MNKILSIQKIVLFLALTSLSVNIYAQRGKNIYESPDMAAVVATHKLVAILPFEVTMKSKKLPKGVTPEMVAEDEKKESVNIQNSIFTFLLRKSSKYNIKMQDTDKTRALLAKNNLDLKAIQTMTKDEIAKVLEVDGIISGSIVTEKIMSQEAGLALGLLGLGGSKTNQTTCILQLHDSKKGDLLWRYDRQVSGGWASSTDDLVERIMRQVARNFPYKK
ncbi:MAG: hypothetical protein EAZ85_11755 [Bacteroidetes bacterium]|nr:MAG: hypothetical protein EAZ85_11755 [Bacteroidota bacterium]TAG86691.1 MAG: hypothetical protein EAZ20_12245 [Bacteroidota bacterium]